MCSHRRVCIHCSFLWVGIGPGRSVRRPRSGFSRRGEESARVAAAAILVRRLRSARAALAAAMVVLALPAAAQADDLVAKRAACVETAKDRIAGRSKAGTEFYRFLVERRKAYVQKCMEEKQS